MSEYNKKHVGRPSNNRNFFYIILFITIGLGFANFFIPEAKPLLNFLKEFQFLFAAIIAIQAALISARATREAAERSADMIFKQLHFDRTYERGEVLHELSGILKNISYSYKQPSLLSGYEPYFDAIKALNLNSLRIVEAEIYRQTSWILLNQPILKGKVSATDIKMIERLIKTIDDRLMSYECVLVGNEFCFNGGKTWL